MSWTEPFFVRALMSFRRRMADLEANSAAYQNNSGKKWVRFVAWVLWALVHIAFLVQFRNRVFVMLGWLWTWVFHERGARLIVDRDPATHDAPRR